MTAKKAPSNPKKWAQGIDVKKGTLHKALGIPESKKVGSEMLNKIVNTPIGKTISTPGGKKKITSALKHKAQFALNINKK